jgi:hypothetical protein
MRNVTETDAVGNLSQVMGGRKPWPYGVKTSLRLCALASLLMLTNGVALCQNLGPYTFTLIDSSPAGYRYSVGNLSNQGEVAFTRYDPGGAQTVYLGSGGALTKIADLNSSPGFLSISGPSITRNESVNIVLSSGCPSTATSGPSVVFSASVNPTGEGIYVGNPNQPSLTTIVQGSYGLEHGGINDNKAVAFYENGGGNGSIWKGDATQTLQIDSSGIEAQSPVINDDNFGSGILSGTVSYYSATGSQILLDSNLTKNTLATTCGGYAVDPQTAINNNGLVAFTGRSGNATALCTEQLGGAENLILSNPAGLIADFDGFDINIEGIVAFVLGFESYLDI